MRVVRHIGAIVLATAAVAGCRAPEPEPRTVAEFLAEPEVMNGVLLRCAERPHSTARDPECVNARVAADRLVNQQEAQRAAERAGEFERQRELVRQRDEQRRRAAEAAEPKFDPYRSPVATEESAAGAAPAPTAAGTTPPPAALSKAAPARP